MLATSAARLPTLHARAMCCTLIWRWRASVRTHLEGHLDGFTACCEQFTSERRHALFASSSSMSPVSCHNVRSIP